MRKKTIGNQTYRFFCFPLFASWNAKILCKRDGEHEYPLSGA